MYVLQDSFGPQNYEEGDDAQMKDVAEIPDSGNNDNVENENNEKIISQIINLKFKTFFKYLISLFKKRDNILKVQFLIFLKNNKSQEDQNKMEQKEINKILLSHIISEKITTNTKKLFYIYKYYHIRQKIKYFEFWKRYIALCISLENEFNSKNAYDKKINELNKKIKNMNQLKDNLKQDEKKINKSVLLKEEQKNNVQKNIKNLSNKCKQLQKEKENSKINNNIMNVKNASNNRNNVNITTNSTKNKESEEKKMELEINLRQVKEEDSKNDNNFKNFINVLDNELNNYTSKANDIIRQRKQKSLEISKADDEINNEEIDNIINNENFKNGKYYKYYFNNLFFCIYRY